MTEGAGAVILAAWSPGEVRVAVVADGTLHDYAIWRPGSPDGLGDLWRGRVTAQVPAMAGAFVAIGAMEGFLPDSEGAKGLIEGAILTVRITRTAQGGKGPRLSAKGIEPEDGPPGFRRPGIDPLRELAARYPSAPVLTDDHALSASLRADLGAGRVQVVPRAFDDGLEAEIEALAASELTLESGARLAIWPTPALVAIDVDAGSALGGARDAHGGAGRRHRTLNESLVPALARQIRLRNLAGAILVDFAGMKAKQRASLGPALTQALAGDPMRPRFLGFTALGLAEITRPRARAPLHETLSGPLAAGLTALRAIAAAIRATPGRPPAARAAPAVVAALEADSVALTELAGLAGQRLTIRSDPSLSANAWRLEASYG